MTILLADFYFHLRNLDVMFDFKFIYKMKIIHYIYLDLFSYICQLFFSILTIIIRRAFNKFPGFFCKQAFKFVVDSWKSNMFFLYILWDDWPIFMILGSNEQLQQEFEYTWLKPDYHSWWISKM